MLTTGGTSLEHTAGLVAQVAHPGAIITVESGGSESLERRWFRIIASTPGMRERTVEEKSRRSRRAMSCDWWAVITDQPLDLHKPEPLPRTVEIWTVFNWALIGLAPSLLLIVGGAALARMSV